MTASVELPKLYVSMPHECSYLPDRIATTLFADPNTPADHTNYSRLAKLGFRRSGNLVYRPHCENCRECVAVRIPVSKFKPNRSQRRVWARNEDLLIKRVNPEYSQEHFELYKNYQRVRHTDSSMDSDDPNQYRQFIFGDVVESDVYEFRRDVKTSGTSELLAVAVTDKLEDGLSAVYTFFNPSESRRALGVYSVLYEIELARRLNLPYLYLGYYIADSQKMNYKINYQPIEGFIGKEWIKLSK